MTRTLSAILFAIVLPCAASAQAPSPFPAPTPAPVQKPGYGNCLLSAIANEDVYKDANGLQYQCFGPVAEGWFNELPGGKEVQDKNGLFIARYFEGSGYCAHQTKSATGAPVSSFLCVVDRPAPKQ